MSKTELTKKGLEKIGADSKDTGSTASQIAILSEKIDNLAEHLKTNKKDLHSTRGLLQMIADRRKLIKYLKRKDLKTWEETAEKLGLKK
ncbi:30S ribosomal protein S15 [Candidatus Campbellbacteria bacterium]|nr:MAG: 30S ribosomal protein S15 [Candidatus Campbellbacteria bacterium]